MGFKFIAINGDNVGDSIGNAIATDNHEELNNITSGLKNAHAAIEDWIASVGGETITSSGDEGIYKVPSDSFDESTLENLRTQYSDNAGTTLTIGIGDSMSEASKALIYGKLNDKDQVVEYDPHIDDYIASHDEEAEMAMPEIDVEDEEEGKGSREDNYQEEIPEDEETAVSGESPSEETDESIDQDGKIVADADDMVDEHEELVDTLKSPSHEDDLEEAEKQQKELDEYKKVAGEDKTISEEGELSEEEASKKPEDKLDEMIGEDVDGDGDIDAIVASDNSVSDEEGAIPEEMEMVDQSEEDAAAEDKNAIADMIHSNMEDDEDSYENEENMEEIRQDIISSLRAFKENKPMLEQAKTQNPKLYEATILMLRSMIEMAKMHGLSPMEDATSEEEKDALPDAAMLEDQQDMETGVDSDLDEDKYTLQPDEDEVGDIKNKFEKSEITKLYNDLMKAVKVLEKVSKKK